MEFIAEDELQEPDGGICVRPRASASPKSLETPRVAQDTRLWREEQQDPTYCARVRACPSRASMADKMGSLPENVSEKEARRFPSAVRGVAPVASTARRRSGDCSGRKGSAALCVRGGEKAKWCGEEGDSPAPLFIGEAW